MKLMTIIERYKLEVIGFAVGALAGWIYWFFVGCASGTCSITSSPVNSTIYGAIMGALIFGLFNRNKKEQNKKSNK